METQEFRRLATDELDAVYRMAVHLTRNPDNARDLVQETYLRAFRSEATFVLGDRGIRPWLFKILHNVFYTAIGKSKAAPTFVEDLQHEAAASELDTPAPTWDLTAMDWERVDQRLKHAIEDLPDHYRTVLLLWAVEGLKYQEIADVLGIALGTVMSRLYRARGILSSALSDLAKEYGLTKRG